MMQTPTYGGGQDLNVSMCVDKDSLLDQTLAWIL